LFFDQLKNQLLYLIELLSSDDLKVISAPIDFLGINYYTRSVIKNEPGMPFVELVPILPPGNVYSQMWEIYPQGIYELLTQIQKDYHPAQIMITENGVPAGDDIDLDDKVRDVRRIQYLQDHLIQVRKAMGEGVPVTGYLVWSLMDNFEWAHGYRTRFGLVYVDFDTLKRTVKLSGEWYRQVISSNGFAPKAFYIEPDL